MKGDSCCMRRRINHLPAYLLVFLYFGLMGCRNSKNDQSVLASSPSTPAPSRTQPTQTASAQTFGAQINPEIKPMIAPLQPLPPAGELAFKDNGDGTITDLRTGLMWEKSDSGWGETWSHAMNYCKELSMAGYSDWRLPDKDNWVSLWADAGLDKGVMKKVFSKETLTSSYWSSSVSDKVIAGVEPGTLAWRVYMGKGYIDMKGLLANSARCVRGIDVQSH